MIIQIKLIWLELQRRWVRVPFALRTTVDRFFAPHLPKRRPGSYDADQINTRVEYYCKLQDPFSVASQVPFWRLVQQKGFGKGVRHGWGRTGYYVRDLIHLISGLSSCKTIRLDYRFGDVTTIPPSPTIVKSRPIAGDNANSVLLNICRLRHFRLINDPIPYERKRDCAVWRGAVKTNPERRQLLVDKYIDHPLCDVGGNTKRRSGLSYLFTDKNYMGISEQLHYKFIISVEGVDVASNLKWIMSSNSLCIAQKLHYETWFMEGTLIPDFHYVLVADDFSDLGEKIEYYLEHEAEAREIIANANAYVSQFRDTKLDDHVGRQVLLKYQALSGQIKQ